MQGIIEQINISGGGLPKYPILWALVSAEGIQGDGHAHPKIHGGPRRALLLITAEGIDTLKALGYPLFAGAMGENLTTRGLDRRAMRIGQRYRAGSVLLELTKARGPCNALNVYGAGLQQAVFDAAVKRGDARSPLWGLSGFYASVIESGEIRPQDKIVLLDPDV